MTSMKNFLKFKTRQNSAEQRKYGEEHYLREAKVWRPFRLFGVFAHLAAMIFIVTALSSSNWINGTGFEGGLWDHCYQNHSDSRAMAACPDRKSSWQNGVIGLMIFAATFGFLASVLSICGVFTNPLPRKIYYFHSAGEIFFICAITASVALIVFPIAIETDSCIHSHRYGLGYGLGWAGALFLLAAAVCLSLDDLVRESSRAKCCRWCFRAKQTDRSELRQV